MKVVKAVAMLLIIIITYPFLLLFTAIATSLIFTFFYLLASILLLRLIFQNCFKCRRNGHNSKKLEQEYEREKKNMLERIEYEK